MGNTDMQYARTTRTVVEMPCHLRVVRKFERRLIMIASLIMRAVTTITTTLGTNVNTAANSANNGSINFQVLSVTSKSHEYTTKLNLEILNCPKNPARYIVTGSIVTNAQTMAHPICACLYVIVFARNGYFKINSLEVVIVVTKNAETTIK